MGVYYTIIVKLNCYTYTEFFPFVLVGTKSDLASERKVSFAEAQAFADKHRGHYVECSSKTDIKVRCFFNY